MLYNIKYEAQKAYYSNIIILNFTQELRAAKVGAIN